MRDCFDIEIIKDFSKKCLENLVSDNYFKEVNDIHSLAISLEKGLNSWDYFDECLKQSIEVAYNQLTNLEKDELMNSLRAFYPQGNSIYSTGVRMAKFKEGYMDYLFQKVKDEIVKILKESD